MVSPPERKCKPFRERPTTTREKLELLARVRIWVELGVWVAYKDSIPQCAMLHSAQSPSPTFNSCFPTPLSSSDPVPSGVFGSLVGSQTRCHRVDDSTAVALEGCVTAGTRAASNAERRDGGYLAPHGRCRSATRRRSLATCGSAVGTIAGNAVEARSLANFRQAGRIVVAHALERESKCENAPPSS
jgi:hypothetical protein